MRRVVACSALLAVALVSGTAVRAQRETSVPPALQRFLATSEQGPAAYRAFRHLEARNGHLSDAAWMDVWTTADESGFVYQIVGQGGSGYVRDRVFVPALEAERTMWGAGAGGALTHENYTFEDLGGVGPRQADLEVDSSHPSEYDDTTGSATGIFWLLLKER